MHTMKKTLKPIMKKTDKLQTIYNRSLITRTLTLPMNAVSNNIDNILETNLSFSIEGKCIEEGFVKPGSVKLVTYSNGLLMRGNKVSFEVVFECMICYPVEGMLIQCVAQNITKAGIKGVSSEEDPSPVIIFIARDHNYNNDQFNKIEVGDKFSIRVIGQRFELNDKYISVIAEIVKPKAFKDTINKPKIVIDT